MTKIPGIEPLDDFDAGRVAVRAMPCARGRRGPHLRLVAGNIAGADSWAARIVTLAGERLDTRA